ncbi:ester hydrolase C11orf54 homolog [Drosophila albomicans]|uniref:Ester hydrolase C11orf54 homolog n=1 Tax=Drosophila albomicans TaxID=7291 RepID=A0A6P8WKM5_DROAB|nr:ester hydrolase C11orf54 homolog [Drosophila albomicans]
MRGNVNYRTAGKAKPNSKLVKMLAVRWGCSTVAFASIVRTDHKHIAVGFGFGRAISKAFTAGAAPGIGNNKRHIMSSQSQLNTSQLRFEEKPLHVPALEELQNVIQGALAKNFKTVSVSVGACPDLKAAQYGLVESGLGGKPTLLEVGGPPFLLPLVQRDKLYNITEITRQIQGPGKIFAVGAGAGPYPIRNSNCEGIYNLSVSEKDVLTNGSYTATVRGEHEECVLERIPNSEPRCALLLNLYLSRGEAGNVLKISAKQRKGEQNFIECIRKGLEDHYGDQVVGLGGIFVIKKGAAHQHVMRDFSKTPIHTDEEVNQWLKFYEMPAQLNALGTLVTKEHDLDLRLQHFHSFSFSNWGGHYHYDTTPDIVEYEAYLNVAERVVRVDKPVATHKVGRD